MSAIDVNAIFARAETAYQAGRHDAARADLAAVLRAVGEHAAVLHLLALVEKQRGAEAAARDAFRRALALAPDDREINNNYANLLKGIGERELALRHYGHALAASPDFHAARLNRALVLQALGRHDDAMRDLDMVAGAWPGKAAVQAARGASLWALRRLEDAATAYDRSIAIEPRPIALHGRAMVARQAGDADAVDWYRRALAASPGNREVQLGLAEALEVQGDPESVAVLTDALAAQPDWWSGHATLARMRWEAGEAGRFTATLEQALARDPSAREGWLTLADVLAAAGQSAPAADAAAAGIAAIGDDATLRLLEAVHASEDGQLARADAAFASLPADLAGRNIHEIRHRLRTGDTTRAAALAELARLEMPWDIGAWAMSGICWRLLGDERAAWLLEQPGFVTVQQLDIAPDALAALADRLRSLHRSRVHPIGQSLRGGTQTRGRLFDRQEPELVALKRQITDAVTAAWTALPPFDAGHPLLRLRDAEPRLSGSWSVRLTDGGFHIAHMHPQGVLSSACYIVVPQLQSPREGWLEIGGAPDGLVLPIEPLHQIEPRPGRIVLFPSYCYHGTRPFGSGERLSVAFDIVTG